MTGSTGMIFSLSSGPVQLNLRRATEQLMTETYNTSELHPFEYPLHFEVNDLRVVSELNLDGEEGQQEAPIDRRILGKARLDPRYVAMIHGEYLTNEFSLSIESDDYSSIVQHSRELRAKFGDPPRDFQTKDQLATIAGISHIEREVSEVGILWDTNWSLSVTVSHGALEEFLQAIRHDRANKIHLSVQLNNLLTDESLEPTPFWQREPAHLFMKEAGPWGYVSNLVLVHEAEPPRADPAESQQRLSLGRRILRGLLTLAGWAIIISLGFYVLSN